jgi:hypothetical protein
VRSWWSSAADSGLAPGPRSTEARMSSMSIASVVGGNCRAGTRYRAEIGAPGMNPLSNVIGSQSNRG